MASSADEWSYANNGRIASAFVGFAILLLGLGVLSVVAFGDDATLPGVALLSLAIFLLVFSALVFVPRLAKRGAVSFSVYSRRSMDEAVQAVRVAIEASGRSVRVELRKSRLPRPPRIVTAEGIPARFRIESTRHPAGKEGGDEWTEIIESYVPTDEAEAQALREKISEQLAGGSAD